MSKFDCEEHQEDRDEIWSCLSCVAESYYAEERERIVKLLREKAKSLKQIAESIDLDEYMNAEDNDAPYWGSFALDDFADALIKGEQK